MFYQEVMDPALRFGDVVRGFLLVTPKIHTPFLGNGHADYSIDVALPPFCVILTPCCSIGDHSVSLAPLRPVIGTFYRNPYYAEDLTRINRKMPPERAVPPEHWARLSVEQKQVRLSAGLAYAFAELFIYGPHPVLPPYEVHTQSGRISTSYYMIDFRTAFRVRCEDIIRADRAPVEAKCLQLTTAARQELRDKVTHYYGRLPLEDVP